MEENNDWTSEENIHKLIEREVGRGGRVSECILSPDNYKRVINGDGGMRVVNLTYFGSPSHPLVKYAVNEWEMK